MSPMRDVVMVCFRAPRALRARVQAAAKHVGISDGEAYRRFGSWYAREPGARLPQRPPEDWTPDEGE